MIRTVFIFYICMYVLERVFGEVSCNEVGREGKEGWKMILLLFYFSKLIYRILLRYNLIMFDNVIKCFIWLIKYL